MRGIVGYIGNKKALPIIIDGLKNLEYRGYDSAGIALKENNNIKIYKSIGKISNLEKILDKSVESTIGIGHTRWATHGGITKENAHPHQVGNITLVHNGIIENYECLKKELLKNNYHFISDTDTEIACAYIDYLYKKDNNIINVLNKLKEIIRGSYAFGIIVNNEDKIYAIRKDVPLIVSSSTDGNYISSDVPSILKYTNTYYLLDNYDIAVLDRNNITFYKDKTQIQKEIHTYDDDIYTSLKDGYPHYMLKEINEQDSLVKKQCDTYLKDINTLLKKIPNLSKYKQIDIVACGSAYHTGLLGKILIEEYGNIPVNVEIASEYRYKKLFIDSNTLVIAISQSGETADTLASLRIAKEKSCHTLAIVNVKDSSIARESDDVLYIQAGPEIAVATTKAYLLQTLMLSFIALSIGINKKLINEKDFQKIKEEYLTLPSLIRKEIDKDTLSIAKKISNKEDIFFIGRGIDYALSKEGSLKLKEISYIHSESYPAGELKHGTISLIEKDTPVIAIMTDKTIYEKTISNIKEVKARGAYVILVASEDLNIENNFYDKLITVPSLIKLISSLVTIIPLQTLSYHVANLRGCDIDKPRNLAKSVTVE